MDFYLGTHHPNWLGRIEVPLFVSNRTLMTRRSLPRAVNRWCLDSGGFSELTLYDNWVTSREEYLRLVQRYDREIGKLDWAAPQDWMCEPHMLEKTGLTITEHQQRTLESYVWLREQDPGLPFIPILQGWELDDYLRAVTMYEQAGIDLAAAPIVGVGSVCRRQHSDEIGDIMGALSSLGIKLHGFGVKSAGLQKYGKYLTSADSMAWSFDARRNHPPLPGHTHKHCGNCPIFALCWRERLLAKIAGDPLPPWPGLDSAQAV